MTVVIIKLSKAVQGIWHWLYIFTCKELKNIVNIGHVVILASVTVAWALAGISLGGGAKEEISSPPHPTLLLPFERGSGGITPGKFLRFCFAVGEF